MSRVLLVDDDPVVRVALQNLFSVLEWDVTTASDVAEALEALLPGSPEYDAVVLDHDLPDGTGLEVAGVLALLQPRAYVVLHTGRDVAELPHGVRTVLPKRLGLLAVLDHLQAA